MSTSDWITIIGIVAGMFVTTIGSVWHLSNKIGALTEKSSNLEVRFDKFEARFDRFEAKMDACIEKIQESVTQLRIDVTEVQVRLDILWRHHVADSNSPIALNESGLRALEVSKIGTFADTHYLEILSKVRSLKPANAYQAQEVLISVVNQFKRNDDYRLMLQEAAFTSGYDIDSLLFVAALSIRDKVVSDLGFGTEDHLIM